MMAVPQNSDFDNWLIKTGRSKSTVGHYNQAFRYISKLIGINILEINQHAAIERLLTELNSDVRFRKTNAGGHQMYSAALNAYSRYLQDNIPRDRDDNHFDALVFKAIKDKSAARKKRLSVAITKPEKVETTAFGYRRNPDVVAEVLIHANGICELCGNPAPFVREYGERIGEPFLEAHHKIWLSEGGDDTIENTVALCPNCHRKEHHGQRTLGLK